jgi:hypothetical protein
MAEHEHGPFQTEREASETEAVRAVYAAFDADPGPGKMAPHNLAMLTAACEAAGIELGAFDAGTLRWLSGGEPATCAVIAGLIMRAWDDGSPLAYCRHCGMDIEPCPHPRGGMPVCKGWRHSGFTSQPVGAHYCGGRSISPSAEPAIRGAGEGNDG